MDESLRKITSPIIGINLSICFVFSLKKRESLVRFYIETEKTTNININCKIHFSDEFGFSTHPALFFCDYIHHVTTIVILTSIKTLCPLGGYGTLSNLTLFQFQSQML